MVNIMLINGSPRAPQSNSRQYAQQFARRCPVDSAYYTIRRDNHGLLCHAMEEFSDVLLVFPLYADGIPSTLLQFLQSLEASQAQHRPRISVLINCGFIEPEQNDVAVDMVRLFCRQNGYPFGSVLKIGGGEAILTTPFRFLVYAKLKKLAASITSQRYGTWQVTMPLSKRMFLRASTRYWERRGAAHGVSKEQMATMEIEP